MVGLLSTIGLFIGLLVGQQRFLWKNAQNPICWVSAGHQTQDSAVRGKTQADKTGLFCVNSVDNLPGWWVLSNRPTVAKDWTQKPLFGAAWNFLVLKNLRLLVLAISYPVCAIASITAR